MSCRLPRSVKFGKAPVTDMRQMTRHVQKTIGKDSGGDLRLVGPSDVEYVLMDMGKRDGCFSQTVGFSDVT
jgi:hypothetical protein